MNFLIDKGQNEVGIFFTETDLEYISYVVPSSLPKAGMIFFAISSFCRHIFANVNTDNAYKPALKKDE